MRAVCFVSPVYKASYYNPFSVINTISNPKQLCPAVDYLYFYKNFR